jgi:hypothetical protein
MTVKLKEVRSLVASLASLVLVVIVACVLVVLATRLFGGSLSFLSVPTSDLASYGVFLFCAAYVLSR